MLSGFFVIEHNVREAIRQEYELARKHYDEACATLSVYNPTHSERFRAARERLNRARDLYFRGR